MSREFYDPAPAVLRNEIKALRPKAEEKRALMQGYGMRLWSYCGLGGVRF